MRLSTRTQYGLRMLCQLAAEYSGGPLQMGEIAQREGISEKYLGQIILGLRAAGLVASVRGAQGGYRLARPPHAINVREVVEALDGEVLGLDDDASGGGTRSLRDAGLEVWKDLRAAMAARLEASTLADLLELQRSREGYGSYEI